jgi:hypothetical protein
MTTSHLKFTCRFEDKKTGDKECISNAEWFYDHRKSLKFTCRFEDKKTGNKECISNAERFYDHLYMLLHKRGKKDFAINIR